MKITQKQVIEEIKEGKFLKDFSEWCDNKEVVLKAVKQYGWILGYASERLQDDKDIVLEAVKQTGLSLEYASERLKDDKEVVMEAVKQNGWSLKYASDRFKKEFLPKVLLSLGYKDTSNPIGIVKCDGEFLVFLTTEEQNNKEIVLEAIKQHGGSLQYASQEIQNGVGNNNPIQCLEQWIKSEKQQEYLNQRLDKKENMGKIKI